MAKIGIEELTRYFRLPEKQVAKQMGELHCSPDIAVGRDMKFTQVRPNRSVDY